MIFDLNIKDIEKTISKIQEYLKNGYDFDYVFKEFKSSSIGGSDLAELFSIAKARIKGKEKFKDSNKMFFSLEDLRFSTPDFVAKYRASRLNGKVIVDLCSGIGSQSIEFARVSDKVYSIELDARKVYYAKQNASVFGVTNIEFLTGDVTDKKIIELIKKAKPDVIFCDPERLPTEETRDLDKLEIVKQIISLYSKICASICIEVPPQLSPDKISYECEKEYLSYEGELNRLDLYFGELKKDEISVVELNSNERIVSGKKLNLKESNDSLKYLYDVDKAVLKAGLIGELGNELGVNYFIFRRLKKNLFLTSNKKISNNFLKAYEVIKKVESFRNDAVLNALRDLNAKEVILRGEISESGYWGLRKSFENGLIGSEKFYLFMFDNFVLICRKLGKD